MMWEASMKLFIRTIALMVAVLLSACGGASGSSGLVAFTSVDGYITLLNPSDPCSAEECPTLAVGSHSTWSPDGRRVAYLIDQEGSDAAEEAYLADYYSGTNLEHKHVLWVVNSDGSHPVQLSGNGPGDNWDQDFAWSPDGAWIAAMNVPFLGYQSTQASQGVWIATPTYDQPTLFLVPTDGTQWVKQVAAVDDNTPVEWLPDGEHLLVMTDESTLSLLGLDGTILGGMTLDNSHLRGSFFALSPNGRQLAYLTGSDETYSIRLRPVEDLEGGEQDRDRLLLEQPYQSQSPNYSMAGDLKWSPDGDYLMFTTVINQLTRLWLLRVTDGDFALIADFTACISDSTDPVTCWPSAVRPGFSADSDRIIYSVAPLAFDPRLGARICRANVEQTLNGEPDSGECFAAGYSPQWQP
jgi:WD40 repeat protein